MEKYIIELPENTHWIQWIMEGTKDHHPYMDYKQVEDLTPYTEDSAYAHGYTEAESKYREIRDELEKQAYQKGYETAKHECEDCQKIRSDAEQELVKKAYDTAYADAEEIYKSGKRAMYQKGLKDAWEAVRKIVLPGDVSGIYLADLEEIFDRSSLQDVIKDYSASECIEKIRQYEQKKEEQIQVGDEIETPSGLKGYVVNFTDDELVHYVSSEGRFGTMGMSAVSKTGRHFPEIAEVLAKMKEADNG